MTTKFDIGETVYIPCVVRRINIDSDLMGDGTTIGIKEPMYTLHLDNGNHNKYLYFEEHEILKTDDLAFILSPLKTKPYDENIKGVHNE